MAAVEAAPQPPQTQPNLLDHIINPQTTPTPLFTFTGYLQTHLPTLGAPSKLTRPICQDFIKGHCPRGSACPDRHYVPKEERSGIGHLICKHYQRGLCKKGDACEFAHTFNLRDERECKEFSRWGICPQGFCPNGRAHPPDRDHVVSCVYGAHPKYTPDADMHPLKPEVRKMRDFEVERREQEEREEEFWAEEERRRERYERGEGGAGRWVGRGGMGRGRGRGRSGGGGGGGGAAGVPRRY